MRKTKLQMAATLDILGCRDVTCDACGKALRPEDDREHCFACNADVCSSRDTCCGAPIRALYPGLRSDADIGTVLEQAQRHMQECCGHLSQGSSNIYFESFNELIAFTALQHSGIPLRGVPPEALPGELREQLEILQKTPGLLEWLEAHAEVAVRRWVALKNLGRYTDYFARRAFAGSLPDFQTEQCSQGMNGAITWKGLPTMRTAWDLALSVMMLEELKPRTIIEMGTAFGGSAVWLADMQRAQGLPARVVTVDINPPKVSAEGVSFLQGDLFAVDKALPESLLRELPHPFLVIEDAHVNTRGILEYLDTFLQPADYLIIEDVEAEQALGPFLLSRPGRYTVDARYTDYFGHNATCAKDQILRRME